MKKLKNSQGMADPRLLRAGGVALAVLLLGTAAVLVVKDQKSQSAYQEWARSENQKVFDASTQQRLSDQQLRSLDRQLNDSFYERLQDQLPVRILVLGESFTGTNGVSSAKSWAQLLKTQLSVQYGVTVELTDLTLPAGNAGFGTWAELMEQPDGAARSMLSEMLANSTAVQSEDGTIAPEGWDNTKSHALRKNEYDLAILSLGTNDDPAEFPIWYEAVLRALRTKYRQCSVISLLSSQAVTAPELGCADENEEALRNLASRYHADVLDLGAMLKEKDSESGTTGISEAVQKKYTADGVYLNAAGHTLLAETLENLIEEKTAKSERYTAGEIRPSDASVEALDEFHFVSSDALQRLDDYTYVLGKNQMRSSTEDSTGGILRHGRDEDSCRGIVGVDYTLVSGDNDLYIATGDGTHPFGRRTVKREEKDSIHSIAVLNDGFDADRDGNLIISFGTKAQADGLHGLIFGGEVTLPETLDDFEAVAYVGPTDGNKNRLSLDDDGKIIPKESTAETGKSSETTASERSENISESTPNTESTEVSETETAAAEESTAPESPDVRSDTEGTASVGTEKEAAAAESSAGQSTEETLPRMDIGDARTPTPMENTRTTEAAETAAAETTASTAETGAADAVLILQNDEKGTSEK